MSKKLLSFVVSSALIVGVALAAFIPAASAQRAGAPRIETTTTVVTYYPSPTATAKLKVKSKVSQKKTIAKITFSFTGAKATAFSLALPKGTALDTLKFAKIGRDIALDTTSHKKLRYRFLKAKNESLTLDLRSASAKFILTFNTKLLKFTKAETKLIKRHKVKTVGLKFTFVGGAHQIAVITAKVKV